MMEMNMNSMSVGSDSNVGVGGVLDLYLYATRASTKRTQQPAKEPRTPRYRKRGPYYRGEYVVDAIVGKRKNDNDEIEYEVKWGGYEKTTFEPISNLTNCINKVYEYEEKQQQQASKDVVEQEEQQRLPNKYVCDVCEQDQLNQSAYHIHRFQQHQLPIPRLDSEIGVVEETKQDLIKTYQRLDQSLDYIFDSELGMKEIDNITTTEQRQLQSHEFVLNENGVLYAMDTPTALSRARTHDNLKLVVPRQMRHAILKEMHSGVMSSHSGISHMTEKMNEYVWWPRMRTDIIKHVNECKECQRSKRHQQHTHLSRSVSVPTAPFSRIGVDVVGPLPTTMRGNCYLLTVVDHLTRYAEAFPMKEATTIEIADIIIKNVICRHGLFDVMVSDQGGTFVSELATYIYKQLGINKRVTTAYHPQSNGVTERFNGTLKQLLKMWSNEEQDDWDELLCYALFSYNTNYHRIIQEVPFFVKEGRMPKQPIDYIINKQTEQYDSAHTYADELVQRLKRVQERVTELYQTINSERESEIDESDEVTYELHEKVWLFDPTTKPGKSRKLTHRWKGPCEIVQVKDDILFTVLTPEGKKQQVNKNRLRKYVASEDEQDGRLEREKDRLQEEIEAIKSTQIELLAREANKQSQLDIVNARQAVENHNRDVAASSSSSSSSSAIPLLPPLPHPFSSPLSPPTLSSLLTASVNGVGQDSVVKLEESVCYAVDMHW